MRGLPRCPPDGARPDAAADRQDAAFFGSLHLPTPLDEATDQLLGEFARGSTI